MSIKSPIIEKKMYDTLKGCSQIKILIFIRLLGCVDRRFTEKRQEKEKGTTNTFVLEEKERKKEG